MSWPYSGTARRPLVTGRQGLVSCAHSLAAVVGHEVLRSGGNAVDAAVGESNAPRARRDGVFARPRRRDAIAATRFLTRRTATSAATPP